MNKALLNTHDLVHREHSERRSNNRREHGCDADGKEARLVPLRHVVPGKFTTSEYKVLLIR